jgi:hypothetical protein
MIRTGLSAIAVFELGACTTTETVNLLPESTAELGGAFATGGNNTGTGGTNTSGSNNPAGGASSRSSTGTRVDNLPLELIHRYDFSGTGTEVVDRAGGESGVILGGATLDGSDALTLNDGVSYVRLPSWLIKNARLSSLTIATWITWQGGSSWQRVFDFGATNEGTDEPGTALSQFYFTPKFEPFQHYSTLFDGYCNTDGQATIEGNTSFPVDTQTAVVVVVDGDESAGTTTLRLYLDGVEVGTSETIPQRLTAFTDQNCWLGQSQWTQENNALQHFHGSYDEFRIYSRALTAEEVGNLSLTDPTTL